MRASASALMLRTSEEGAAPPSMEELLLAHTLLAVLQPPPNFLSHETAVFLSPSALLPGVPFFRYKGLRSLTRALGKLLGGVDPRTEACWAYAADDARLQAVAQEVVQRHLRFCEDLATMRAAARWCRPNGTHSLLAPGKPRWLLLRALAQFFYRQRNESEYQHLLRCWRWDAWVGHDEYAKPAIAVLLLLHIALLLSTPETPSELRLTTLADGARVEDMDHLQRAPEAFCSLHPCEPSPFTREARETLPSHALRAQLHRHDRRCPLFATCLVHRCSLGTTRRGG